MNFKQWLENRITNNTAKQYVLDAVGGSNLRDNEKSELLNSLIKYQPNIIKKFSSYPALQTYASNIQGWINANADKTLLDLINYVDQLDGADI